MKELTGEATVSNAYAGLQDEDDSDKTDDEQDTCDVPSSRKMVDAIDVLRCPPCTQQDEGTRKAVWLCKCLRDIL